MQVMTDEELHDLIENEGTYHKVDDPRIMEAMGKAREDIMAAAHRAVDALPPCRERDAAVATMMNTVLPMIIGGLARHQEETLAKWANWDGSRPEDNEVAES